MEADFAFWAVGQVLSQGMMLGAGGGGFLCGTNKVGVGRGHLPADPLTKGVFVVDERKLSIGIVGSDGLRFVEIMGRMVRVNQHMMLIVMGT